MIHYIIHEFHPADIKVIFDLDENPDMVDDNPYIYQGDCCPLHHKSNYVLIVYCKRPYKEKNNHFVMDYVKSLIQEKMQLWMNIMIKYFTLPASNASSLDAPRVWIFRLRYRISSFQKIWVCLNHSLSTGTKAP